MGSFAYATGTVGAMIEYSRVGAEKAIAFETPTEGGHGWSDDRIQWGVSVYNPKTTF